MRINDIRLIGGIVMVAILGLAIVGMDWVSRVELGLLGLLILAQVDVVIGSFIPPSNQQMADGFVGINSTVLQVLKIILKRFAKNITPNIVAFMK